MVGVAGEEGLALIVGIWGREEDGWWIADMVRGMDQKMTTERGVRVRAYRQCHSSVAFMQGIGCPILEMYRWLVSYHSNSTVVTTSKFIEHLAFTCEITKQ